MTEQMNLSQNKCAVNDRTEGWHSIDWKKAHRAVRKLQVRIAKAEKEGKSGKVKALQRLLTTSFYGTQPKRKRLSAAALNKQGGCFICLSRVQGNLHARFLGEGVTVRWLSYPTD